MSAIIYIATHYYLTDSIVGEDRTQDGWAAHIYVDEDNTHILPLAEKSPNPRFWRCADNNEVNFRFDIPDTKLGFPPPASAHKKTVSRRYDGSKMTGDKPQSDINKQKNVRVVVEEKPQPGLVVQKSEATVIKELEMLPENEQEARRTRILTHLDSWKKGHAQRPSMRLSGSTSGQKVAAIPHIAKPMSSKDVKNHYRKPMDAIDHALHTVNPRSAIHHAQPPMSPADCGGFNSNMQPGLYGSQQVSYPPGHPIVLTQGPEYNDGPPPLEFQHMLGSQPPVAATRDLGENYQNQPQQNRSDYLINVPPPSFPPFSGHATPYMPTTPTPLEFVNTANCFARGAHRAGHLAKTNQNYVGPWSSQVMGDGFHRQKPHPMMSSAANPYARLYPTPGSNSKVFPQMFYQGSCILRI